MNTKVTLSFDKAVITKAKIFAKENNITLSQLTEVLLERISDENYKSFQDFPIADWVKRLAEGKIQYKKINSSSTLAKEYFLNKL